MVISIVFMLMCAVWMNSKSLQSKLDIYRTKESGLEEQIQAEVDRAAEIEEFQKYTKTKAYYEAIAREKLGLVYPDELIIKPNN